MPEETPMKSNKQKVKASTLIYVQTRSSSRGNEENEAIESIEEPEHGK